MILDVFYPTNGDPLDPGTNRSQTMLFDSGQPQMVATANSNPFASMPTSEAMATTSIPTNINMNITNIQDMPATNENFQHNHHQHGHHSVQTLPCFNDLIAVLIECFALIAIGYLSGRFKLISSDAKDIGAYLTTFALPMIIFLNVAQMKIETINLSFLACMLVSKLLLFVLVTLITLAISYPANFSYAGALSILATQSNDFALGYPLFKSLYGESKPEMLSYLNLMGPIQLLIINPLGIVMLEFEKSRTNRRLRRKADSLLAAAAQAKKKCLFCLDNPPSTDNHAPSLVERATGQPTRGLSTRIVVAGETDQSGLGSGAVRRKNIKSLALVMPARGLPERHVGEETMSVPVDCFTGQTNNAAGSRANSPSFNESADSTDSDGAHALPGPVFTKPKLLGPIISGQPLHVEPSGQRSPQLPPSHQLEPTRDKCTCWTSGTDADPLKPPKEPCIDLGFVKALLTNPLIIASVVALAVNLINGPELPKFVTKVSNTIAASFAAPALFVVGLSMYGKFKLILRNPNDLLLSSVLVLTKVFVLPNLMRTIMLMVLPHYADPEEIPYLADFSYLYGLLPTAPGACIIAKQYEVLTNVVSICMLLSTFISAPMMLGTSAIISQVSATAPENIVNILAQTLRVSSSLTLTLSLLTLYMLWKSNRRIMSSLDRIMRNVAELKATHVFTFLLALTQLVIGLGGFLWLFVDTSKLRHQSFVEMMAHDGALLTASSTANDPSHWPRDDVDDFLANEEEERLHTADLAAQDATAAAARSFLIAPSAHAAGFGALCTMKYVLSSGGLLMARFLILCIVVTNFAKHFRGHQLAVQVSSLMLKVYPLFGVGVILCLVFESRHLSCLPSESSLPRWTISLILRLIFNSILLLLAVPLFTATFRLTNKADWSENRRMQEVSGGLGPAPEGGMLKKRRFVTSSASLSSDTSSAMTTSTSLEATLNQSNLNQQAPRGQGALQRAASQPMSHEPELDNNHHHHAQSQQQLHNQQSTIVSMEPATLLLVDYDLLGQPQRQHLDSGEDAPRAAPYDMERARGAGQVPEGLADEQRPEQKEVRDGRQLDSNNNNNNRHLNSPAKRVAQSHNNSSLVSQDGNQPAPKSLEEMMINQQAASVNSNTIPRLTEAVTALPPKAQASLTPSQAQPAPAANALNDQWPAETEFNKYSILIVFMLFQALVSLTSIIQLLNQDKPSGGTFVMGEITNVAIDFGQGLVTFLVIGSQSYFKELISSFGSSASSSSVATATVVHRAGRDHHSQQA